MKKLTRDDLLSLEQYSEKRPDFRARVLAHKKDRKLHIGPTATLYFEEDDDAVPDTGNAAG